MSPSGAPWRPAPGRPRLPPGPRWCPPRGEQNTGRADHCLEGRRTGRQADRGAGGQDAHERDQIDCAVIGLFRGLLGGIRNNRVLFWWLNLRGHRRSFPVGKDGPRGTRPLEKQQAASRRMSPGVNSPASIAHAMKPAPQKHATKRLHTANVSRVPTACQLPSDNAVNATSPCSPGGRPGRTERRAAPPSIRCVASSRTRPPTALHPSRE